MRTFNSDPARSLVRALAVIAVIAVAAAFSSTLMGCPDKASPDPAAGKNGGTAAATATAPAVKAGAGAAAPAKSGGW